MVIKGMQHLSEQERYTTWLTQPQLEKKVIGIWGWLMYSRVDVKKGIKLHKRKIQYRYLTKAKCMRDSGIKLELEIRRSLTTWN